jgi:hypothetical protein
MPLKDVLSQLSAVFKNTIMFNKTNIFGVNLLQ